VKVSKEQLTKTVKVVDEKLKGETYALRGTASLVLQGIDMNIDDIDVLCDAKTAISANSKLSEYLIEEVVFKESPKFISYFGKFLIDGVNVEIMGDWQIFNDKKGWSRIFNADNNITRVRLDGLEIPVTKIEVELEMFALMGRWLAYQKIKRQIGTETPNQQKLF